jgi:hypothetical protein
MSLVWALEKMQRLKALNFNQSRRSRISAGDITISNTIFFQPQGHVNVSHPYQYLQHPFFAQISQARPRIAVVVSCHPFLAGITTITSPILQFPP